MRVAKTIWGRITPVHAAVVGILFLSLSGIISFRTLPTTLQAEESGFSSVLFGIEDKGNSESIFFSFSEKTGTANQLGTNQSGADFEASDIHPTTGEWYAIKGEKGNVPQLYRIDKTNGLLSFVADIPVSEKEEFVSAAFRPDGTFWAFQEKVGLYTINVSNGTPTLVWEVPSGMDNNWEGITWNSSGDLLYGADGSALFRFSPSAMSATEICGGSGFLPPETEALATRHDGSIVGSSHKITSTLTLFSVDPDTCTVSPENYPAVSYTDVETIAYGKITTPYCEMIIEKTADKNELSPSEDVTFTITIRNTGTGNCTGTEGGVEVKEYYDPLVSIASTNPAPTSGNDTWDFGTVEPGEEHTITVKASVSDSASDGDIINNKACVWAKEMGDKSNDGSWVCDEIEIPVTVPQTTLVIDKWVSDTDETMVKSNTAAPGEFITYVLKVQNTGNTDAENVIITDDYDQSFVAITNNGGGTDNGDTIIWNAGNIPSGSNITITVTAAITAGAANGDIIPNTALVTSDNAPSDSDSAQTEVVVPSTEEPVLNIVKTVSDNDETKVQHNTAIPGEIITYTIVVTNSGTATAKNASLVDDYDETFLIITDAGSGIDDGDTINYSLGDLTPGEYTTITITGMIKEDVTTPSDFENTALATADNTNSVSDTAATTVNLPSNPIDLALQKTVDNEKPALDSEVTFTITITNEGNNDASGVIVTDLLPSGLAYVSDTANGDYDPGTGEWTVGSLAAGDTKTFSITAIADIIDTIENIAEVTAANEDDVDSTPNNNDPNEDDQDSATITVLPSSGGGIFDLELTKNAAPSSVTTGATADFTITVTNTGDIDADSITVTDLLPSGLAYVSDTANGDYDPGTGEWTVGSLAAGDQKSLTITVKTEQDGTFTNTAEITAVTAPQTDIDSTPNNNDPNEDDQDSATVSAASGGGGGGGGGCTGCAFINHPKIFIEKQASAAFVNPGATTTYTLIIENKGDKTAENVRVVDTLPDMFFFVPSLEKTQTWDFGDLPAGASTSTSYTVLVDPTAPNGVYENTAVVTITNGTSPYNRDEDTASVEVRNGTIAEGVLLAIGKTVSPSFTNPGTSITYTVTVQNNGKETARNVTVTDTLPIGFLFTEGGTEKKVFPLGDMGSGEITSFSYTVQVTDAVPAGFYINTAIADADNAVPVTAEAEVEVRVPQVAGITYLPETGPEDNIPAMASLASLILIAAGVISKKKKELHDARIRINFLANHTHLRG